MSDGPSVGVSVLHLSHGEVGHEGRAQGGGVQPSVSRYVKGESGGSSSGWRMCFGKDS